MRFPLLIIAANLIWLHCSPGAATTAAHSIQPICRPRPSACSMRIAHRGTMMPEPFQIRFYSNFREQWIVYIARKPEWGWFTEWTQQSSEVSVT